VPAPLVQDAAEIDADWLAPDLDVGLTAGASTPDASVQEVLARLAELGWTGVQELPGESEPVTFRLPAELVGKASPRATRTQRSGPPPRAQRPRAARDTVETTGP
jgi:hypothetical protein